MKKSLFSIGVVLILALSCLISCQNDFDDNLLAPLETSSELSNEEVPDFELDDAQNWIEENHSPIMILKTEDLELHSEVAKGGNGKRPIALQAVWKHAFVTREKKLTTIEVELRTQGRFGMASPSAMKKYESTGNRGYLTSLSRLLVIQDKKEKKTDAFIMTIMGEPDYLESTNFELYNNTYLEKEADFAGLVFFHDLDGTYVNGWRMEEGKVIGAIEVRENGDLGLSSRSGSYDVYTTVTECTDWYNLGETVTYNGSTCTSTTFYSGSYYTSTSTNSYGGNAGVDGYSGGGSNSGVTSTYNTAQNLNRNKLCGGYSWTKVGRSKNVNITGLGFTAYNAKTRKLLEYDFPNLCVTVPEYLYNTGGGGQLTITNQIATTKFNLAWRQAVNRTLMGLSPGEVSSYKAGSQLLRNLAIALSTAAPGSKITQGVCNGVSASAARYCL